MKKAHKVKKSNKVEPVASDTSEPVPGCSLCGIQWKPKSSDIWGPSLTSLQGMQVGTNLN